MEQRRNERAGEMGDPQKNPPNSGIVRHDSHMRKFEGGGCSGNRARSALGTSFEGPTSAMPCSRPASGLLEISSGNQTARIDHVDARTSTAPLGEGVTRTTKRPQREATSFWFSFSSSCARLEFGTRWKVIGGRAVSAQAFPPPLGSIPDQREVGCLHKRTLLDTPAKWRNRPTTRRKAISQSGAWGGGGAVVRLLVSQLGEPGSISGGVAPGFSHVVIVPDDGAGRQGDRPFPHPFIPALLRTYLASPSSALKTSMLRAGQISPRERVDVTRDELGNVLGRVFRYETKTVKKIAEASPGGGGEGSILPIGRAACWQVSYQALIGERRYDTLLISDAILLTYAAGARYLKAVHDKYRLADGHLCPRTVPGGLPLRGVADDGANKATTRRAQGNGTGRERRRCRHLEAPLAGGGKARCNSRHPVSLETCHAAVFPGRRVAVFQQPFHWRFGVGREIFYEPETLTGVEAEGGRGGRVGETIKRATRPGSGEDP
ncbi:hypothetical protein PR048_028864 [Dryococelus australis]|uniref:Uncharacterized protein n=1 Tax=Dryococelus australis TaxID=614101 RepID=A0ABQ9GBR7_9NEOP|nr:hypothetical protein PR048_028864 [Dryococelus australis]